MRKTLIPILLLLFFCGPGCTKYARLPFLTGPAYLRVFNDIGTTPTILNNGNLNNFLTFVMDPVMDGQGSPVAGSIVGDYLATRQLYTISYPSTASNTITGSGYVNYEYPGRAHVLTAPALNGFDCSSWAQIPPGTHHIVFIARPNTATPFDSLSFVQRSRVLIDTTLNFSPGELYTVEAVLRDVLANTYGAYIRQEEFIHKQYAPDSVYAAMYNLSATVGSSTSSNVYSPYLYWFTDSIQVSATPYLFNYTYKTFDQVPNFTVDTIPINQHFAPQASYLVYPLPPQSDFFDPQGNLGAYGQFTGNNPRNYGAPGQDPALQGTLPFVIIDINNLFSGSDFAMYCWASPINYNETFDNMGGQPGFTITPNLNLISGLGNQIGVYATFDILEVINDKVYLTQIQKGFNNTPQ